MGLASGCAYDLLGIDSEDPEAEQIPSDPADEPASSVAPGCPAGGVWCERGPLFRDAAGDERPPGELRALVAASDGRLWVGGEAFSVFRWDKGTWYREYQASGELDALWVDESGRGVAVGHMGTKRRIVRRDPAGKWHEVSLPADLDEGGFHAVTGVVTGGKLTFIATTRSKVLLKLDPAGGVERIDAPVPLGALGVLGAQGSSDLLLAGAEGIWRLSFSPNVTFTQELGGQLGGKLDVRRFVVARDWVWALGADGALKRPSTLDGGWVRDFALSPEEAFVAGCATTEGDGPVRIIERARVLARDGSAWHDELLDDSTKGVTLLDCAVSPDGTGWAVGFFTAPSLRGAVLEYKVP